MSDKPGGVAAPDTAPGSPSGEWSDEQHHVAPEGAQRLGRVSDLLTAEQREELRRDLAAIAACRIRALDLLAARARADRMDRIIERVDAAEHDPGTEAAWADGCSCERQDPRAEWWDVNSYCEMHGDEGRA